jgi:hypothetical protein
MRQDGSTPIGFPERFWWIGVLIATGLVVVGGVSVDLSLLPPETPYDHTRSGHAEQWRFLREVSLHVPAGATFTINAPDADTEMSLYAMAVGLLPEATAVPRTYYGRPVVTSASARFVVTFGAEGGSPRGAGLSIAVAGGSVTDRGPRQP